MIKLKSARSLKLGCTAAVYHQDGNLVAAGGEDGSLHLIQLDRPHAKHQVVREAHKVRISTDGGLATNYIAIDGMGWDGMG